MNRKAMIAIASALVAGIVAVLLVNRYLSVKERDLYKGMEMASVVAVTSDLPAGTRLSAQMLARRSMPQKYVHGNAVTPKDANLVVGQVLNFPLKRGDPLLWSDIGAGAEGAQGTGLATTITKGERALSFPVDVVSGVSGLLKPNDHVDILSTIRSQESGEEATITLLQNITILATGGQLAGGPAERGRYNTLTVLVTLEEAELIVFAQKRGELMAVLRNPEDIETFKEIPKVTFKDIMKSEYRKQIQVKRDRIEVIKKGRVTK
jgi:pilus assembly protein CpaB